MMTNQINSFETHSPTKLVTLFFLQNTGVIFSIVNCFTANMFLTGWRPMVKLVKLLAGKDASSREVFVFGIWTQTLVTWGGRIFSYKKLSEINGKNDFFLENNKEFPALIQTLVFTQKCHNLRNFLVHNKAILNFNPCKFWKCLWCLFKKNFLQTLTHKCVYMQHTRHETEAFSKFNLKQLSLMF